MMFLATVETRMEDFLRIFLRNTCIQIAFRVLIPSNVMQIFLRFIVQLNFCIIPVM